MDFMNCELITYQNLEQNSNAAQLTVVCFNVLVRKEELHDGFVQLVGHLDLYGGHVHLKVLLHRYATH